MGVGLTSWRTDRSIAMMIDKRFCSAKDRNHGRVGHTRDGGQLGEPEMRDTTERPRPGLHILVPEQQASTGLRQGRKGDRQRAAGCQHDGGHVDHQQCGTPRLWQLYVSALQPGLGQRVPARSQRYGYTYCCCYFSIDL